MSYRFKVASGDKGKRLLAFLRDKIPEAHSVKWIKRGIEQKHCKINGRHETFSTALLKEGDEVEFDLAVSESLKKGPVAPLVLIYEDDEIIICNKPSGMVSDNRHFNSALVAFGGHLQLVHRLDKETSGAIILAKNRKMKEKIMDLFAERKVDKTYLAIVDGVVKQARGKMDTFLAKKYSYHGQTVYGSVPTGKGQQAITVWKCLKRGENASLLLCEPMTGRTHQIRVHVSEMGHPILGDMQYGKHFRCPYRAPRLLLHSYSLAFKHPTTQLEVRVTAPPPTDFVHAEKDLFLEP